MLIGVSNKKTGRKLRLGLLTTAALGSLAVSVFWTEAGAQETKNAVEIKAKELVSSQEEGVRWSGKVVLRHGELELRTDTLQQGPAQTQKWQASGKVHVSWQSHFATGQAATYRADDGLLELTGPVRLWQGDQRLEAKSATLDLKASKWTIQSPRGRVMWPGGRGGQDNEAAP